MMIWREMADVKFHFSCKIGLKWEARRVVTYHGHEEEEGEREGRERERGIAKQRKRK